MADHSWMPATIGGERCFVCGVFRQHHDHDPTVYYDGMGGDEIDECPPCEPKANEVDKFLELYATLPECDTQRCHSKATHHAVERCEWECDKHAERYDCEEVPWAHIVRREESCQ